MKFRRGGVERYKLDWPGKREAENTARTSITKTIRPRRDKSKNFDATENLFIEGDNLDALKLLQRSYQSKIKLIYIDPPYNTGKDFVYRDNFRTNLEEYKTSSEQVTETGDRLVANPETIGRFHSDWLSMMYPRLKLARNLLREDGVIFISIDNGEAHNLRKICDEIYGEPNFVADIIWRKKPAPSNDAERISDTHDYILVYAKNSSKWIPQLLPRTAKQVEAYKNPDNDPRGPWMAGDMSAKTYAEQYDYVVVTPSGKQVSPPGGLCWRLSKEKLEEMRKDNRIWFGKDGSNVPTIKRFLSEVKPGVTPVTIWSDKERDPKDRNDIQYGYNTDGRRELKDLFDGQGLFDNPKPVSLIEHIIFVANVQHGDIVLDFFAGSGTTAQAVMQYSAKRDIKANFILTQLDEATNLGSHARKAGYESISDITVDRIKRASRKVEASRTKFSFQDYGFRAFKIDTSNLVDTYYSVDNITQDILPSLVETVKPDRNDMEDLLFQVLCDNGVELTLPIERKTLQGTEVLVAGRTPVRLIACFDGTPSSGFMDSVIALAPEKVVLGHSLFNNDSELTNTAEYFKQKAPTVDISLL